jgi:hypothetical protein
MGCSALTGEEISRLAINKVSTKGNFIDKDVMLELKQGDEIAFWSEMDMAYEGDINLRFRVKIFKNDIKMSELDIDPMKKSITIGEVKTSIMNKTKWSFTGKNYELKIEEDASYRIAAILIASNNPSLEVTKAELIIKK